jgi:hypothetical protein
MAKQKRRGSDDLRTPLDALIQGYIKDVFGKTVSSRDKMTAMRIAVRDLLTDIRHICYETGVDFDERVQSASEVFEQELAKDEEDNA